MIEYYQMKRYSAIIILAIIVVSGSILRFYRIEDLGTFRSDQAIELASTAEILRGKFTLIGIKTSVSEVRNGAVMYYIMAPFLYLFAFDPLAGGIVQSLLSLATIPVVFYFGKKLKTGKVGLLASLIIAASPLLVRFSRQTMLAFYPLFFCSLALFLAGKIIIYPTKILCFALGVLLGFMLQVHYSTISVFGFALAIPALFYRKNNIFKYYLFLLSGFVVGFTPMLIFELRHQFFNTRMLLNYILQANIFIVPEKFDLFYYWENTVAQFISGENILLAKLYIIGFLILSVFFWRKFQLVEKLSILQLVSTVVFTVFFVRENVPHYAIASFVPLAILSSSYWTTIVAILWRKHQVLILLITMITFLVINYPAWGLGENHGWTMTQGWSLSGIKKAAKIIFLDLPSPSYNVAMVVDAENRGLPLRYFLEIWGKPPLPVEKYDKADVLYVVTEPGIDLAKINMWEINSFGGNIIEKSWMIQNGFMLYRLGKKQV